MLFVLYILSPTTPLSLSLSLSPSLFLPSFLPLLGSFFLDSDSFHEEGSNSFREQKSIESDDVQLQGTY